MFGLYFHWPFCTSKCIYCDFGSQIINTNDTENFLELQKDYLTCCKKQLLYFSQKINAKTITSIYFGGGTPSLLDPNIIKDLLNETKNSFELDPQCEITLETNPTSFEIEKFEHFNQIGINRISLGIQSMNNNNLIWLGRKHTIEQGLKAIEEIKKIFKKWNIDLIYGFPKQSLQAWLNELQQALSLNPTHLSLYTLIIDTNTVLGQMVERKIIKPKTENEMADFYIATNNFISQHSNLLQYEVSNYSLQEYESKHNLLYWKSHDYIGIGAGAHGRLTYKNNKRYEIQNIFNPLEWQKDIQNNGAGLAIEQTLNTKEQVEEILLMGLRITEGINLNDIQNRYNINLLNYLDLKKLDLFKQQKYLYYDNHMIHLTSKGLIILDTILKEILKD